MQFDEKHRKNLSISGSAYRLIQREYEKTHGKKCSDCKIVKPVAEFDFLNRARESRVSVCKPCKKLRFIAWSKTESGKESDARRKCAQKAKYNTEERKLKARVYRGKVIVGWYEYFVQNNLDHCCKCGYDKNTSALELHHVEPHNKEYALSKLVSRPFDEKYISEIKKCICVCSNCHRELHHQLKQHTMKNFLKNHYASAVSIKLI